MQSGKNRNYLPNLPVKPIKHILKKFHKGEISEDACYYVKDLLLKFTEILAEEAEKEFEKSNSDRKKHGIPILKRLDKASFIEIWGRFFKRIKVSNIGEVGKDNNSLLCQDGAKNG
jgi:hypothetical protein